ncbi:CBS domain-containing protein [Sinomonas humi]|nr:CBS domain-containing protein [Sinomonas humi]
MTRRVECIGADETLEVAARRLRDLDVGALPVLAPDGDLAGMLTDRDIVIRGIAEGSDARSERVGAIAARPPVTIDPEATIENAIALMEGRRVRRLPVIQEGRLVGILAQADVARYYATYRVGELIAFISQ